MSETLALTFRGTMGISIVEAPVGGAVFCIAIVVSSCTFVDFDDLDFVPIVAILRLWVQKRGVLRAASRDFEEAVLWAALQRVTRPEAIFAETTFRKVSVPRTIS